MKIIFVDNNGASYIMELATSKNIENPTEFFHCMAHCITDYLDGPSTVKDTNVPNIEDIIDKAGSVEDLFSKE